jgi:hypothetical protein
MMYVPLAQDQVDAPGPSDALEPYRSYFRIWLDELFLARAVDWGKEYFPAVQSEVRVDFGGQGRRAFSTLARAPEGRLGPGARLTYALTELLPFNGGTVEVEASLIRLPGKDNLAPAVDVLNRVSALVAPPLAQVVALADTLAGGIQALLAEGEEARLGLHHTLVSHGGGGTAIMRAGSLAVIAPDKKKPISPDRLRVRGHQLHVVRSDGNGLEPLTGVDYFLLRVEGREERDAWLLPDIHAPLTRALICLEEGNPTAAGGYRAVALAAAYESPEIAEEDRRRVIDRVKAMYADAQKPGYGATGAERADLTAAMARAMPRAQARALGPVTEEELFT